MSNILKIKRSGAAGTATPASLAEGEPAYSENSEKLFIGTNAGADIHVIGGKFFTDIAIESLVDSDFTAQTSGFLKKVSAGVYTVDNNTYLQASDISTVLLDSDFPSAGFMKTDGAGNYSIDASTYLTSLAGAVLTADTDASGYGFVIDEDNMASNSATKLPTQQSVKAYVDATVASGVVFKGGYNAATNSPDLDTSPSGISIGDMYTVTAAGTFFTEAVEVGDVLIAETAGASTLADWAIVQTNLTAASIKSLYESNADTNEFSDAEQTKLANITGTNTGDDPGVTAVTASAPLASSGGDTPNITSTAATAAVAGHVTVGAQAFGGTKTFDDISGADAGAVLDSFVIDGGTF